ncbi:MAG: sigma-70 family RNA polymerase sigma factor [Oscillospiraceae bacterium]|nr:sigma-70 family RNA polymerase sigma factor [Oscillospiraceae bacterium]
MLSWLLAANTLLLTLRLSNGGSFPKPLSASEEREWLTRLKDRDPQARNVLIERNLRLVAHIVKKYYAQSGEQEDLISIGTIGLMKAVSTFNPDKGVRLATYAARCIENAILSQARLMRETPLPSGKRRGASFTASVTACISCAAILTERRTTRPCTSTVSG